MSHIYSFQKLFVSSLLFFAFLSYISAEKQEDKSIPSEHVVEMHHSLHRPMDQSRVYWNFGGSTVVTKNYIRLTPSAQGRKGWLWNDYPIESDHWEITFDLLIDSKPHFGGDGMAFWMLKSSMEPAYQSEPDFLSGPIMGLKRDFQGLGVLFDIYDNDGLRDNPKIFVIEKKDDGEAFFDQDHDYLPDMYKRTAPGSNQAYQCRANLRPKTGTPLGIMVKFVRNILHVYVDNKDDLGYKFCLAVEFDEPLRDHHIAFTAMTGDVADSHDIHHLSTKYLTSEEETFDENMLVEEYYGSCGTLYSLYIFTIVLGGFGFFGLGCFELFQYKKNESQNIQVVAFCANMNSTLGHHFYAYMGFCIYLLVGFQFKALLINLPLACLKIYYHLKKQTLLREDYVSSEKYHGTRGPSFKTRMIISIVFYGVGLIYYLSLWFTGC